MQVLTEEQKDRMIKINQRLGLPADAHETHHEKIVAAQSKKTELVFSADPLESDVPPIHVMVGSIAEFKKLVGTEDDKDDSHIQYPEEYPEEHQRLVDTATSKGDLLAKMDERFSQNLKKAAYAYVMGNSKKVAKYESAMNAIMFPGRIAVFTGHELQVPDGQRYRIQGDEPVLWNFGVIKVGKDSEIKISTMVMINSQIFIQE
jgi:hypothetical protein